MSGLDPIPEENMAWDSYYRLYYEDDDDENDPENNYTYTTPPNLAEGGYHPTDPTTSKTSLIPGDDDDTNDWDDFDLSKMPVPGDSDRTQPFEPGASSTPAGEQIPMVTRTRLPQERGPRTAETSFMTEKTMNERMAWREVKGEFEMADESKLKVRYVEAPKAGGGGGGAVIEVAMRGKDKWYRLYTKSRGDTEKSFNKSLPKQIQAALGASLDEQFDITNAALKVKANELAAKQKQLEQAEQRAAESQKFRRDMDALTNGIREVDARIRELEDAHGPLDTEAIQRLKDGKRGLEADKQSKRQQLSQLQKDVKQADKIRSRCRQTPA